MARLILCLCILLVSFPAWAKTVTDVFGRAVEVPDKVERVIGIGSSLSFVTYLGAQEMIAGVEDM
ncbi:MAG TPA: ABC transporter substrate-binding protein, partial [Deferribacteraceae bacterium]|nr:ABC transporter substrate-binding protein [Deferribacteraceae bacterium]